MRPLVSSADYEAWRSTALGRTTEALESAVVFELAGALCGQRLLDIGTGDGFYAVEAHARGARTVAIDPDDAMVAAARRRATMRNRNVHILRAEVEALPFRGASFDVVLAVTVLCFVRDPRNALREIRRVLSPGGRLIVGELGRWSGWAALRRVRGWLGHATWRKARFSSRRDLRRLMEAAGFSVEAARGAIHYPPFAPAARALFRIDPALGRLRLPGAAFLAVAARKPDVGR